MQTSLIKQQVTRKRRAMRVRSAITGSVQKPRMCVVKSNKHIQVQLIDDENGRTLASISTQSKELKKGECCKRNKASAKILGEKIAGQAKNLGIERVVFDRGPFKYHGILAELADAARAGGLQF